MARFQSRRCSMCAINWPDDDEFAVCPKCEQKTRGSGGAPELTPAEARREKAYSDFDRFYEERDQKDRRLIERTEPFAFAQYLMDSAEEQVEREQAH